MNKMAMKTKIFVSIRNYGIQNARRNEDDK